ncbi:MAG: glycosyltransferase family 39 protein [Methylococcaceae bacterium]|jgi:4-amino-4-deoxy-L-arabinose transferase-like glycosyltransferase
MKKHFILPKNPITAKNTFDIITYIVLLAISIILFVTAPKDGDFWWSEAPRNALNGALIFDFLKEAPLLDPINWAKHYYYQYPALTILFYPPTLYICIAIFYIFFGVSHTSAIACISVFSFFLSFGIYKLACRIATQASALAASILVFAAPEILTWSQQVMLEIPMMCFSVWAAFFLIRYSENNKWQDFFIFVLLILAASYTKQIAVVVGFSLIISILTCHGFKKLIKQPHVISISLFAILLLIPLVLMQLKFGSFNIVSVVDRPEFNTNRLSLDNIFWYFNKFPTMMGWPLLSLCIFGIATFFLKKLWLTKKIDSFIYIFWFLIGYTAMTIIDLKEPRHGIYLLIPLIIITSLFFDIFQSKAFYQFTPLISLTLFALAIINYPTPHIEGYNKASQLIAEIAPPNAKVLFAGNQDGNFIFNIRQNKLRHDISIIRADKLFLNVAIMPNLGLNPKQLTIEQISQIITQLGISYVVTVPYVWAEAKPMAYLAEILESTQFQKISSIKIEGKTADHELVVYKNLQALPTNPIGFDMELRAIGMHLNTTN